MISAMRSGCEQGPVSPSPDALLPRSGLLGTSFTTPKGNNGHPRAFSSETGSPSVIIPNGSSGHRCDSAYPLTAPFWFPLSVRDEIKL
jgi:hypothetical protein